MPHRLNAYLASNPELRQFSNKARQLASLQQAYELIVPASLRAGSRVLQLRQQLVVIAAYNGAVAAKLRQMTGELISLFQARGCEVTGIQIRVQVTTPPFVAKSARRKLGPKAHMALEELGQQLEDSPLKAVLHRLSRHG